MKRLFTFFAMAIMAMAVVGCSDSYTPAIEPINPPAPEPPTPAKEVTLSLECLEIGIHDVTIKVTSENAVDVRYIAQRVGNDDAPTAEQVIRSGTKVDSGESVVKIENLYALTTHNIYVAAANIENKLTFATLQVTTEFYPDPSTDKKNLDAAKEHFDQMIAQHGNYDTSAICDKEWRRWSEVYYNEDWSEVYRLVLFDGENMGYEGNCVDRFIFSTDGTYARLDVGPVFYVYNEYGTWEFDPETRYLKFNITKYESEYIENIDEYKPYTYFMHLIALDENTYVWDTTEGYTRYEYIVKE